MNTEKSVQLKAKYEPGHEETCFSAYTDQLHGNSAADLRGNSAADQHLCFCYKDGTNPSTSQI